MQHYQFVELKYPLVTAEHLKRTAVIYVRQSTEENAGSRALCQSQVEVARAYGWSEHLIEVIDVGGKHLWRVRSRPHYWRFRLTSAANRTDDLLRNRLYPNRLCLFDLTGAGDSASNSIAIFTLSDQRYFGEYKRI
jgi:hypothetical protein